MGVTFGRDFDVPTRPQAWVPMRVFKWTHADEVFRAQKAHADAEPYTDPHEPDTLADTFKLYEEIRGEDDKRELLIECKMALRRLDYFGGVYQLYLFPLRGTDFWAVLEAAQNVLGPVQTMIFDDPGLSAYFAADSKAA